VICWPNKDFVLRWRVAGGALKSSVVAQRDKDGAGGYFAMMLIPPANDSQLARKPVDLCFVLDISGSMSGTPLDQSKAAMQCALSSMQEGDTFEVIRFASNTESLSKHPLPATAANIRKAMKFVSESEAGGGTMMLDGITKALNAPTDETRTRYLCLLSDGQIGNEADLITRHTGAAWTNPRLRLRRRQQPESLPVRRHEPGRRGGGGVPVAERKRGRRHAAVLQPHR